MNVKRPLSRQQAYDSLLQLIRDGQLDPAQPLSERTLAESLGMGRMPVREALKDLSRDGLLEVIPSRGTFLRRLSFDEVGEVYEIRHALEGMAAFLAAERGATPALRAYGPGFKAFLADSVDADIDEIQSVGAEFHVDVFKAARNSQLLSMYEGLRFQIALTLKLTRDRDHARVRATVSEHVGILEAIESGDAKRAQQSMCDHLARALDARMRVLAKLGNYSATPWIDQQHAERGTP
jgi:DNA-binding GntR family transcriptional regulator